MSFPLHPELTFADLRATSEAGMAHSAKRWTEVSTRLPNGEYVNQLTLGAAFPCRLKSVGSRLAEIAAAQGAKAQWSVVCPSYEDVTIDQRIQVAGETDGISWTREIIITADLGLTGKVHRQTLAIDVGLDQ